MKTIKDFEFKVKVEAIDDHQGLEPEELKQQGSGYFHFIELTLKSLIANSYSDLILEFIP